MAKATLKIDIWTEGKKPLPVEWDLMEALAPHVEHVASLCHQGFNSGQIVDEEFSGWWTICDVEG